MVWQPDVYLEAASLAALLGATTIVDVGCGSAEKVAVFRNEYKIVGVDFGVNIEACRARYDWGDWIGADLDDDDSPLPLSSLNDSIVVCADVIEHVVHPERLLRKLRDLLERGATALVLTTPERDLRRGRKHIGPSPNVAHVREWALDELRGFMADEGLEGYFGLTRTNDTAPYLHTIFAVIPGAGLGARAEELSAGGATESAGRKSRVDTRRSSRNRSPASCLVHGDGSDGSALKLRRA